MRFAENQGRLRRIAEDTAAIDWPLTMRLSRGYRVVDSIRRDFRQTEFRRPNVDEVTDDDILGMIILGKKPQHLAA